MNACYVFCANKQRLVGRSFSPHKIGIIFCLTPTLESMSKRRRDVNSVQTNSDSLTMCATLVRLIQMTYLFAAGNLLRNKSHISVRPSVAAHVSSATAAQSNCAASSASKYKIATLHIHPSIATRAPSADEKPRARGE